MNEAIDPKALGLDVVRVSGDEAWCRCVFKERHRRGDVHPSASFNIRNGLYHCFGCGASGNARSIAKVTGGVILRRQSIAIRSRGQTDTTWRNLLMAPIAVGHVYLHSRGFTDELVVRFQVRATEDSVIFPVFDDAGNVVGVIVRYLYGAVRYRSFGSKAFPWGLNQGIDQSRPVWVTEGPFGAVTPISLGYQTVAVAGAAVNHRLATFLSAFDLRVAFDDDPAGYLGAKRLVERAPRVTVAIPGFEADEIGPDVWDFICRSESKLMRASPSFLEKMARAKAVSREGPNC